jgi:hypothetical protein
MHSTQYRAAGPVGTEVLAIVEVCCEHQLVNTVNIVKKRCVTHQHGRLADMLPRHGTTVVLLL